MGALEFINSDGLKDLATGTVERIGQELANNDLQMTHNREHCATEERHGQFTEPASVCYGPSCLI